MEQHDQTLIERIQERATVLDKVKDLQPLIDQISQSRVVMLGESSHGTHEFYEWRRLISEWLISKHGFNFIAVEGDWPPCAEINKYIKNANIDLPRGAVDSEDVLKHFNRWPTWMWANSEIVRLTDWLKNHNATLSKDKRVGFYGLDVYSLFESADAVIKQLKSINPFLARRVQLHYACFDPYQRDEKNYARSLIEFPRGCEPEVLANLQEILKLRIENLNGSDESLFDAQQNARVVANAENYYRTMIHGQEDSWNVRDRHMTETLKHLLDRLGPNSKAIVWAHNTHIGDYRATDMERQGQINLGGLARDQWGKDHVSLVGFGTYQGTVIASHSWDGPIETMRVPPGRHGSYEAAFHEVSENLGQNAFFLTNLNAPHIRHGKLSEVHGHRAIGVVYNTIHESISNYVPTSLSQRYDAFIFLDQSNALQPLQQGFDRRDIPETWPRGQ